MKVEMTQLYLCEEPYWSKYDQSDLYDHPIEINVISDGEYIMSRASRMYCAFKNKLSTIPFICSKDFKWFHIDSKWVLVTLCFV